MSKIFLFCTTFMHTRIGIFLSLYLQTILAEECFCNYHNFYKMEICQFCKKVCSGERGLSLHVYTDLNASKN